MISYITLKDMDEIVDNYIKYISEIELPRVKIRKQRLKGFDKTYIKRVISWIFRGNTARDAHYHWKVRNVHCFLAGAASAWVLAWAPV